MSMKSTEERLAEIRNDYINYISELKIKNMAERYRGYYSEYQRYRLEEDSSCDAIRPIYKLIDHLLNADPEFKKKYESRVKKALKLAQVYNNEYPVWPEVEEHNDYNSEEIYNDFVGFLRREEWDSPHHSTEERVYRPLLNHGLSDKRKDPDSIMDTLLMLLSKQMGKIEDNRWAKKLSEIASLEEELEERLYNKEMKEKKRRELAEKHLEIIRAIFKGAEVFDNEYALDGLLSDMICYCGDTAYDVIRDLDDETIVNNLNLKQFIVSKKIHTLVRELDHEEKNPDLLYERLYDSKETGKLEVIKSLILANQCEIPETIFESITEEEFISIIKDIKIDDSNIGYLLYLSPKISKGCVKTVLNLAHLDDNTVLYEKMRKLGHSYPEKGVMYLDLFSEIHVPEGKESEHKAFKKELLEQVFTGTIDSAYKHIELSQEQLEELFKTFENLEELKDFIYKTILLDDRYITKADYFKKIVRAYYLVYNEKVKEYVDYGDFVDEFVDNVNEKREIMEIQKSTRGVFNYTGSNMYEKIYEDEKVKISYLDGINGLFVEEKGYEYNKDRYYLYPAMNEEGETFIAKRSGVLPKKLLEELTSKEDDTAFSIISFRTDHYTKYMPNEEVSDKGWPTFTKESYINLTGDDSLSDDEAFDKTCKIIKSNPVLKKLIKISQKTYKKEANE